MGQFIFSQVLRMKQTPPTPPLRLTAFSPLKIGQNVTPYFKEVSSSSPINFQGQG